MFSVYKRDRNILEKEKRDANERLQKQIFENKDRKLLNEKLTQQYKARIAHFVGKMAKNPVELDDTKHKLEFSIPTRHHSTFRPSFCQTRNIKTGTGNNNDLKVSVMYTMSL